MSGFTTSRISLHTPLAPRNVEQIVKAAQEYEYNAQVPVRYWLRTASALLKEAEIYMREGDDETTYLLLYRHAHLILGQLEAHPDAKDKSIKPLLLNARREVDRNLKALDLLKPKINQRYDRYTALIKEREQRRTAHSTPPPGYFTQEDHGRQTTKRRVQQVNGSEDSELAVRLAQQEFQRRAHASQSASRPPSQRNDDRDDLSQRLQAIRSRVQPTSAREGDIRPEENRHESTGSNYSYPTVRAQHPQPISQALPPSYNGRPTIYERPGAIPPAVPPKPRTFESSAVPPRPEKRELGSESTTAAMLTADTTYTFTPTAALENGNPLRTLFLPPTLRTTFLRIAHGNTKANLETCGFLAGTLISNALFVSKLIIPAQTATSDTCEMTNESELFDYVDSKKDLMILGWIHTHPTQTCFMSSRDLHTHAAYQMMLPESVAVVCAPSKGDTMYGGDWGAYRLTDPPGKMTVLKCDKPGVFHPHDVDNIYTDALRPGHVVEAKGLEFEVVDLRSK